MANAAKVIGLPRTTEVTTEAALKSAILAATAGEVIRLTQTVAAFPLTISASKPRPGISIVLPQAQVINKLTFQGADLNTEVVGGTILGDHAGVYPPGTIVDGKDADTTNHSVVASNASRFALRGATVTQGVLLFSLTASTDFEITDIVVEWARNDVFQIVQCSRFKLQRIFGRQTVIKGQKMVWYKDGRPPLDRTDKGNGVDSFGVDTSHNDFMQIRNVKTSPVITEDFAVLDNDVTVLGAGVVSYGDDAIDDRKWNRALIARNHLLVADSAAICPRGTHIEVSDNIIGPHPWDPGTSGVNIRLDQGVTNARGGRNTTDGLATIGSAWGVDFASPTIMGTADAPVLPVFTRLPWAPPAPRPAFVPYTGAPEVVTGPNIFTADAATVGAWFTCSLGTYRSVDKVTAEFRWTRNDVPIPGATSRTYQGQEADRGIPALGVETRIISPTYGASPWKKSRYVVPISA